MLAAAPRWAVHQALAEREPDDYRAAAGRPDAVQQLGVLPSMEDAAIAYRLLLEVCLCVNHTLQLISALHQDKTCTNCEHHDTTLASSCATDMTRAHEGVDFEYRHTCGRSHMRPVQACSVLVPCRNDGEPSLCRLRGGCCAAVQYGECVGVADWFGGFCAVYEGSAGGDNGEDEEVAPKRKRRGRAPKADPKQVRLQNIS
jgi:hypothetical protein